MKKIIAIAVAIVVVLGTVFYLVTQPRSTKTTDQSQTGTSTSQQSSSAKSSESSSSSENSSSSSSQASSTAPAGNNAGNSNNASNSQPSNPQSNWNQSASDANPSSSSSSSATSVKNTQDEGQGHPVHNEQDAIDVVKSAMIETMGQDNDIAYVPVDPVDSSQPSGDFYIKLVLISYVKQGGSGAAGIYRVSPDGHYVLIN